MSARRVRIAGVALVLVVACAAAALYLRRRSYERKQIAARTDAIAKGPVVLVVKVMPGTSRRHLSLPGEARAFLSTTVYAKLPGYMSKIFTDKGKRVKKTQLLAIVTSPETDQDVRAAETDLALRRKLAARADNLARQGVMSEQDREIADAQMMVSAATLQRQRDLQRYQILRAPYDGLVTARYADPGALIPAATGSTAAQQPIVDIADTSKLRITIYLDQLAAATLKVGDPVTIWTDEQPNRRMPSKVSLASGQLVPQTRTMLTEIWFDNREAQILPGTFVHVELDIVERPIPTVPNAAIIVRAGHLRAAVVENNHIHFVPIEVGSSDGNRTQVTSGLSAGEPVAVDLPAELGDGAAIQARMQ